MIKSKKQEPIYVCAECQGTGLIAHQQCKSCHGLGTILFLNNQAYYWGTKMSYLKIRQRRNEKKIRVLINSLLFIFGLAGLISLFVVLYEFRQTGFDIYKIIYIKDDFSMLWWVSLLVDMYLIYRINKESKIKAVIEKKPRLSLTAEEKKFSFDWNYLKNYKKIEISKSFDTILLKHVENAWLLAYRLQHASLKNIHLFTSLLPEARVSMVFARLGVNYPDLSEKIKRALNKILDSGPDVFFSAEAKKALLTAYWQAYNQRKIKVGTTDLLYAVVYNQGMVEELLYDMAITQREIAYVVAWVDLQRELVRRYHEFRFKARFKPKHGINRTYTAIQTSHLDAISRDMTLWAKAGAYAPLINREKEIGEIFKLLEVDKLGSILVGAPGVGKRAIVEGLAQLMVKEDVPKILQDKRLVEMSVSGLIAGASQVGEMEQRIITVMDEVARSKNIILFIDDIHHMVGVSAEGGKSMDVAEVLAEQMQGKNFYVLATTTPEFYKKYLERSSLAKVLQKVVINEPKEDEAIPILEAKALTIEAKNKIYFSYQAIEKSASLSKQYLHDEYLPEKGIKILEESALSVLQRRGPNAIINSEDIAQVVSNLTNIPVTKIGADETKKLLNLEEKMHQRIIGQDEAVKLVASALRRARTELRKKDKPIASFLFLGPTGVGKTEVARTLAMVYFGSEKNMLRVDMSEYQAADAMAKLIGDVQSGRGGYLAEQVRTSPFALVLLDEIEKATPDILNIFLQVLDEGRLTDATGKTVDFTNTIIIGTSNAGTQFIQESIEQGKSMELIREALVNSKLKAYFKPELLNRFDGIVVFKPLIIEQVREIAKLFLGRLASRLEAKGIAFEVQDEAVIELANLGFDPALGARPLRRVIQDRVEDKLAKLFLEKKIDRRDELILKKGFKIEINKATKL